MRFKAMKIAGFGSTMVGAQPCECTKSFIMWWMNMARGYSNPCGPVHPVEGHPEGRSGLTLASIAIGRVLNISESCIASSGKLWETCSAPDVLNAGPQRGHPGVKVVNQ